ncbi:ArsR family transcriptional regulator [Streptococcus agalactiae LMG 14747]|uniref:ArsR family transcriptional regulator n=1 Tax=Streptococcus agalactiae LMG 14747 TaxID=1154860 RepID=V6Z0Z7_STRAG|nr:ArsR family transcriptional regulator [Streptococcus agalactiae LMG 14747]
MLTVQNDSQLVDRMVVFFKQLGYSTRVRILCYLIQEPRKVSDIAVHLNMTLSSVSHQLRVLREAGLVSGQRQGKTITYQKKDDHVATIIQNTLDHLAHSQGDAYDL